MAPMAEAEPKIEEVVESKEEEKKAEGSTKIEDVEEDEDVPELADAEGADDVDDANLTPEQRKAKQSRSEKKARKALLKLGLRPVPGIMRVTIKQPKGLLFVISKPDVFKSPSAETYVVFGEAKIEDLSSQAVAKAAEQFKANPELAKIAKGDGDDDELPDLVEAEGAPEGDKKAEEAEEDVSEEGVDPADVNLVIAQTNTTKAKAIKALKNNKGDLLSAILEVTESK
eukprot:CAMPEP_0201511100 /NCGR_PEP_ID=MMETSP0161_2-20130828/3600_1 /ASSEMBLY_ACC=CAM_ASM_000251 /TAXON_ID=180227 /ORGANISM="Neoparamoeba aestuarina, Strain SoJaBio B1-5/56/2" /LENGTH=227 /DNA_ID=CAMNT_0047906445 /DNA_START=82 /DNA_END=765 /DNA_ORIENTATION=+